MREKISNIKFTRKQKGNTKFQLKDIKPSNHISYIYKETIKSDRKKCHYTVTFTFGETYSFIEQDDGNGKSIISPDYTVSAEAKKDDCIVAKQLNDISMYWTVGHGRSHRDFRQLGENEMKAYQLIIKYGDKISIDK